MVYVVFKQIERLMQVERFINSIFSSNSYILYKVDEKDVWVIDPGDSEQIIEWLTNYSKTLKGILITHSHFDHIYGINDLQEIFPYLNVFASHYAKEGMMSEKLNGSLYKEIPFTINRQDVIIIDKDDHILLWDDTSLFILETPGHDRDCLSFQVEKNLFTGDALIPGTKIHTKLKYSDKIQAENSIKGIVEHFNDDIMIWPGHSNNILLGELKNSKIVSQV